MTPERALGLLLYILVIVFVAVIVLYAINRLGV